MIFHAVRQMVNAGITEILVVISTGHMPSGCRLRSPCPGVSRKANTCVLLADNIFEDRIRPSVGLFSAQAGGARVVLEEVTEPERNGVAALDEQQVISIEEKPRSPTSAYGVVGLYVCHARVFDIIRGLEPYARGELEISAVTTEHIAHQKLEYDFYPGRWMDAGTVLSCFGANRLSYGEGCLIPVGGAVSDAGPAWMWG